VSRDAVPERITEASGAPRPARASSSEWLHEARPGEGHRLVFFPPAGGSASAAWEMAAGVPAGWSVWGVQYSGRGPRLREPMARSIREIAQGCLPDLCSAVGTTVLFGHSFGAFVAYDVAHLLQEGGLDVAGLVIAGVPAPSAFHGDPDMSDEALVASLTELGGTAPDLAADEEMLDLVLPALRTDLTLGRAYVDDHNTPLRAGLLGLGGHADPMMTPEKLLTWQDRSERWLGYTIGAGGHFFYRQEPEMLTQILERLWPSR
jgi:surfactin synthase thioesterase subunit